MDERPAAAEVRPVEVSKIAANVPFVLRTVVGTALLGILVNVVGVVIVTMVLALAQHPHRAASPTRCEVSWSA